METTTEAPQTARYALPRLQPTMAEDLAARVMQTADHLDGIMATVEDKEREVVRAHGGPRSPAAMLALTDLGTQAEDALAPVRARVDAIVSEAATLEARILGQPIQSKAPPEVRREIRDRAWTMKPEDRDELYKRAARTGDVDTMQALEESPGAFPMVSEATRKQGRREWAEVNAPQLVTRLESLRAAELTMRYSLGRAEDLVNRKTFRVQR